jgi:predicted RNase H-like HicB family nuclease
MATVPQQPESEFFSIVFEEEDDGRWLAEVPELPGVMKYGKTREDAEIAVTALALRVLADRTEQGESVLSRYVFCEQMAK